MSTVFQNLRARGTLAVVGATTLATVVATTITGTAITGTVGNFRTSLSGATLSVGTGIILRDTDGAGCSAIHLKNGVVSAQTHTCL